jgi:hypothetical protein
VAVIPRGISAAAWLTSLSLAAGFDGAAWREMDLATWMRVVGRRAWN